MLYSIFSNLCDLFLSCHNEPKYTLKVKVIKYFLQIFVIWNIWSWKKWGARYTFWYIVLLTLYNGDRRIVQWLTDFPPPIGSSFAVSSRSFYLLTSIIYDLKRSVDLRGLVDPVLHSPWDDLVFERTLGVHANEKIKYIFKNVCKMWHSKGGRLRCLMENVLNCTHFLCDNLTPLSVWSHFSQILQPNTRSISLSSIHLLSFVWLTHCHSSAS